MMVYRWPSFGNRSSKNCRFSFSQPEERWVSTCLFREFIQSGTVQELCSTHLSQSDLALIYLSPGEKRDRFLRTRIIFAPISLFKKETRMMVCSLLELSPAMTVLEIGGGSGGITIDIARRISEGILFSLEKIKKPVSSSSKTVSVLGFDNVQCIHSTAPNDIPKALRSHFYWRKWRFSFLDSR